MRRARAASLVVVAIAALTGAVVPQDRPEVLRAWTRPTKAGYDAWYAARQNRAAWSTYEFDWTTDYCTAAPEYPLGFPFKNACARHDFGYRNYREVNAFTANKRRLDKAFHADLKRVCTAYTGNRRTSCDGMAWTYYHAAVLFGHQSDDAVTPYPADPTG
ncbi:phospholipase [Streptomyces sannanensis]|uniref:Phospholipase n=1 Tax=Streptomyces sannanensis TaxID=285536 RepID=A0ABP6SJB8_9ACTN